eukprot:5384219-Prymnesium_polylepis.1
MDRSFCCARQLKTNFADLFFTLTRARLPLGTNACKPSDELAIAPESCALCLSCGCAHTGDATLAGRRRADLDGGHRAVSPNTTAPPTADGVECDVTTPSHSTP